MHSVRFQKFAGKELTNSGMRTLTGGEDTVIIWVTPPPKKVFPSSSSATDIKQGNESLLMESLDSLDPVLLIQP